MATGLWLWRPPLRSVHLQKGTIMATCPVDVCPRVLITTNRLTTVPPNGLVRDRTIKVLSLCISLLNSMKTLLPVKLQTPAGEML